MHVEFLPLLRAVVLHPTGGFDLQDAADDWERAADAHAEVRAHTPRVIDLSQVQFESLPAEADLARLAEQLAQAGGTTRTSRIAYVAAQPLIYGLVRQFTARLDHLQPRPRGVFRTRADALRWVSSSGAG